MTPAPALFVVPALDGPVSGGTRYNAELVRALETLGVAVRAAPLEAARTELATAAPSRVFVDSLYLHELLALRRLAGATRVALLVHYLPSLVAQALGDDPSELEAVERAACAACDAFVAPSAVIASEVRRRLGNERPIVEIEPACTLGPASEAPSTDSVTALVVGNVVRNKGLLPFLRALAEALRDGDDFSLHVVGGESGEAAYAAECRRLAETHPRLSSRVRFDGALAPDAVEARLHAANLFVSASVTESYGMALAEARAAGVPIVAFDGGNVRAHVEPRSGGELVTTHTELAHAFVRLCREPGERGRRLSAARGHASQRASRTWLDAAKAFAAAFLADP